MLRGIDIYSGDGWPLSGSAGKAYKGSDFVIVKATQGKTYRNPEFFRQCEGVLGDGKLLGVFHYGGRSRDGRTDPVHEADAFWNYASKYRGRAVPCLDWEEGSNPNWGDRTWCRRFAKRTKELWGVWPLVYVQASEVPQVASCYPECGLWLAGYPTDRDSWTIPVYKYSSKPWKCYDVWQFTSGREKVDRNVSPLNAHQWAKLCSPTKAQPSTYKVTASPSLNVRERRSSHSRKLGSLKHGAKVKLESFKTNRYGNVWARIAAGAYKGHYVAVEFKGKVYAEKAER